VGMTKHKKQTKQYSWGDYPFCKMIHQGAGMAKHKNRLYSTVGVTTHFIRWYSKVREWLSTKQTVQYSWGDYPFYKMMQQGAGMTKHKNRLYNTGGVY
jgi:ribosomal protein S27AE